MNHWLSIASAFSLLFLFAEGDSPIPGRRPLPLNLKPLLAQGLELFLHSALLVLVFLFIQKEFPMVRKSEWMILGLFPLSYLLARWLHQRPVFFWASFVWSYSILYWVHDMVADKGLEVLASWVGILILFQCLVLGIHRRMFFMNIPKPLAGWPAFLVLFAFLTAAVEVFHGLVKPLQVFEWDPLFHVLQFFK